jgi:pyrimidine-specific ribonucleoside hydrolase
VFSGTPLITTSSLGSHGRPRQPTTRISVVIDTDAGIDDLVSLALAARSPTLDIEAVTTTYGNTTLEAATRNARKVLTLAGRSDVPVYPGSDRPLTRSSATAPEMHGPTGAGYAPVPPPHPSDGVPNPNVLRDVLDALERPTTLVTLGPLTNLARALTGDSTLTDVRIERHIGMFGTLLERGSVHRWADFNAWCDPEATDRVLRADLETFMVGLDVTRRMTLSSHGVDSLVGSSDPLVGWLGQALRYYVESHLKQRSLNGCVVNDVLPVGELLCPGVLTFTDRRLEVGFEAEGDRGRTRESPRGYPTCVATTVDAQQVRRLLARVLGNDWLTLETVRGDA